jgi:hypothetical protein
MGMITERALEKAYEKFVEVNGETINKALETFDNEDFGDLVPNITFSSTDHSASWKARVVKINEDQTYTPLTTFWAPGKEKVKIIR